MLNIFKKKKVNAECVCEDTKMYSYKECTHVYGVAQTDLTDMEKKAAAVFGFNAHWVIRCSFYNPDKRVAYEEDVKKMNITTSRSSRKTIIVARKGLIYLDIKIHPTLPIRSLSANGSKTIPQSVILFLVLAKAPSIASDSAEIINNGKATL